MPKVLFIRVIEACNAGCFMCRYALSNSQYRFSLDNAKRIARSIKNTNIRLIRLTGGEPLVLDHISGIVGTFANIGMFTSLITNGWYLAEKLRDLSIAGLNQLIVSLDGASSSTHDRYRRLDGLYHKIVHGIEEVKNSFPNITVRINSVIGPHNVHELCDLLDLLFRLGVDQWSIIPLKQTGDLWLKQEAVNLKRVYLKFQRLVALRKRPKLLGYSSQWMGRSREQEHRLVQQSIPMTPRLLCGVVDHVRYYTPQDGLVYPCNCVPHRIEGKKLGRAWKDPVKETSLKPVVEFLKHRGPIICCGCEPINSALGDGAIDLDSDPLGF